MVILVCMCVCVQACECACVCVSDHALCGCIRVHVPHLHITKGAERARHAGNVEMAGAGRQDSDETEEAARHRAS